MKKLNSDFLETGIYAERKGESLEEHVQKNENEHENENPASTDKDWKCCCLSIVNSSLKIRYVL